MNSREARASGKRVLVDADTKLIDIAYARVPYTVISRAMHIHPTISELIPTMLQDLKPLE